MNSGSVARAASQNGRPGTEIGSRVRHARMVQGALLKDVADAAECSESYLSKIENNKVSPSLRILRRLCEVLKISMGELFSVSEGADGPVMRAGERPISQLGDERAGIQIERMGPFGRGHLLEANIARVGVGAATKSAITHDGEEVGYLLEGEIELILDDIPYRMTQGDSFSFRSDTPHAYRNIGQTPARILFVNTPGGHSAGCFDVA